MHPRTRELLILNEKRARNSSHIKFLLACKHSKIYPKFINLKCKNTSQAATRGLLAGKQCWLKNEIRAKYAKQETLDRQSYYTWQECTRIMKEDWNEIDVAASQLLIPIQEGLDLKKAIKFANLKKKKRKTERTHIKTLREVQRSKPFIINLSKHELSDGTLSILERGLSFSHGRDRSMEEEIIELETAIKNQSFDSATRTTTALSCLEFLKEYQFKQGIGKKFLDNRTFFSKTELRACQEELQSKSLLVMKADKGGQTVIMDTEEYWKKGMNYITSSDIVEGPQDNPKLVRKLQRDLRTALKECPLLFPNQSTRNGIVITNPQISQMYGLPKIHKKDVPLRPIVSAINSPMYRLAKFLAKELSQLIRHQPYHISKSSELVQELKNQEQELAELMMFSIDVEALYPSVPIKELDPILMKLMSDNSWDKAKSKEFLRLIHLVNNNNYFIFKERVYHQRDRLAMGSPLAAILALIYMEFLESELVPTFNSIRLWRRYVDDILTFIKGKKEDMLDILEKLNQFHPNMRFTLEEENDYKLPFLDIMIHRKPEKKEIGINIYRKPTHAGRHIDGKSNHSIHHKHAFIYSSVHRIYQFQLDEQEKQNELFYLRQECIRNNIDPNMVNTIHRKIARTIELQQISKLTTELEDRFLPGWLTLNYSKTHQELARRLRKHGIRTAFRANNTTQQLLPKLKSKIPNMQQSGVYKMECGECKGIYIGQTRRSFATRMTEHQRYPAKSTFCEHLMDMGHDPKAATMNIILKSQNRNLLNVKESIEILKAIKTPEIQLLNTVLGPCNGSLINWKFPLPKIFPIHQGQIQNSNNAALLELHSNDESEPMGKQEHEPDTSEKEEGRKNDANDMIIPNTENDKKELYNPDTLRIISNDNFSHSSNNMNCPRDFMEENTNLWHQLTSAGSENDSGRNTIENEDPKMKEKTIDGIKKKEEIKEEKHNYLLQNSNTNIEQNDANTSAVINDKKKNQRDTNTSVIVSTIDIERRVVSTSAVVNEKDDVIANNVTANHSLAYGNSIILEHSSKHKTYNLDSSEDLDVFMLIADQTVNLSKISNDSIKDTKNTNDCENTSMLLMTLWMFWIPLSFNVSCLFLCNLKTI